MDDPLKPKRLEDAITMVGTCMDMCPRFERYRRERENNLFEWEMVWVHGFPTRITPGFCAHFFRRSLVPRG